MIKYSLFVVDDESSIREGICTFFRDQYTVRGFETAEEALDAMDEAPDLVLLDIGLPGMQGIEALTRIKSIQPETTVIMITAYEDVNTVISAMKQGAFDYVVKPLNMEGLEVTIQNALESIQLRKEVQALQAQMIEEHLPFFVGESDAIQNVMDFITRVAKGADTPVLILGETGTGKELIASAIHYRSPNFRGPFVTMNCASIPRDLVESTLFGYEKGAFTGASPSGSRGLIAESKNGTLFLDEVGDLSLEAQAKLLRFLEQGEFYRVGGTEVRHVKTRIVSATNRNLEAMIADGRFRQDLYFRLGVIKVTVPSLNARAGDILPLAKHFLHHFNLKFNASFIGLEPGAERALLAHLWTGNVRELRNAVERAVLIGEGKRISVSDLGLESPTSESTRPEADTGAMLPPSGVDLDDLLREMEVRYFKEALRLAKGNESRAARLLGMNHHTFRYRKKKRLD